MFSYPLHNGLGQSFRTVLLMGPRHSLSGQWRLCPSTTLSLSC